MPITASLRTTWSPARRSYYTFIWGVDTSCSYSNDEPSCRMSVSLVSMGIITVINTRYFDRFCQTTKLPTMAMEQDLQEILETETLCFHERNVAQQEFERDWIQMQISWQKLQDAASSLKVAQRRSHKVLTSSHHHGFQPSLGLSPNLRVPSSAERLQARVLSSSSPNANEIGWPDYSVSVRSTPYFNSAEHSMKVPLIK
jgi:hypothetical protein